MGTILICDSCEVFSHGLTARLGAEHTVRAFTSVDALGDLASGDREVDLVIVDVVHACQISQRVGLLNAPILLLIDDSASRHLSEAMAGILPASVLHRNAPLRTAVVAVEATLSGGRFVDPALAVWHDGVLDDLMAAKEFTTREKEVCRTVLEGCRTNEVARRLGLSGHTVKHHLSSIYAKAGVSGRAELVELLSSVTRLVSH